jgi:hypothetical protein
MFLWNVSEVIPDSITSWSVAHIVVLATRPSDSGEGIEFGCYSKNLLLVT